MLMGGNEGGTGSRSKMGDVRSEKHRTPNVECFQAVAVTQRAEMLESPDVSYGFGGWSNRVNGQWIEGDCLHPPLRQEGLLLRQAYGGTGRWSRTFLYRYANK
jgi:hypothetical protein